jgi:hypothetical protein
MAKNRAVSPSSSGVRPRMSKMYDGKNTATRPIPIIVDESERRAIAAAAADSKPKTSAVNMPHGPRPGGGTAVFGEKVTGAPGNVAKGATFNPITGTGSFE